MTLVVVVFIILRFQHVLSHIYHAHDFPSTARIVSGIPTTAQHYPWIVSIQYVRKSDSTRSRTVLCSGSLIRSEYPAMVLTAAHCVGTQILGYDGRIYYADISRTYPYKAMNASYDNYTTLRAFYYYQYDKYLTQPSGGTNNLLTDYDFGILVLDGSVDIEPITLYNPYNSQHVAQCCTDNQVVRAIGYGYVNNHQQQTETVRYLDMKYMQNVYNCSQSVIKCLEDNDKFTTSYKDDVIDDGSAFCAWSRNACICQGDSGGPLVYIDDVSGEVVQIGIGSQSCCIASVPNMFASVGFFYDEIQRILSNTRWQAYAPNATVPYDDVFVSHGNRRFARSVAVIPMLVVGVLCLVCNVF